MTASIRFRAAGLVAMGAILTLAFTLLVTQAWRADAAPGDDDSTFVPIANCRLFDFRGAPDNVGPKNTPLGAGDANVHTQQVTGANGNCVIPNDAVGVSMNVTVVNPTAQSNLRVFPADLVSTPLASNLNWLPGQSPTPNKVDVKLSATGAIKLYNHAGTVDVVADVVGYYTPSSLKDLDTRLTALEQTVMNVNAKFGTYNKPHSPGTIAANDTHQYENMACDPGDTAIGAWIRSTTNNQGGIEIHSVELSGASAQLYIGNRTASLLTMQGEIVCLNTNP